jgi:hypothetical protein
MGIELGIESARPGAHAVLEAMRASTRAKAHDALAEYEAFLRRHAEEHGKAAAHPYGRLERPPGE